MKKLMIKGMMIWVAFIFVYPFVYIMVNSFADNLELAQNLEPLIQNSEGFVKGSILPQYPTIASYIKVLLDTPEFFVAFWNSVKMAGGVVLGQLFIAVPAAWGFAKYDFKCKKLLLRLYFILMLIPFQVRMFPEYLVLNRLKLLDTYWAIIFPGVFSTFAVVILYYFFRQIPKEGLETARLEGANEWQVFWKIGIPLGMPGIISMLTLSFIEYWNLIEQPMVFLKEQIRWPLALILPNVSYTEAGVILASSVITCIPSVLVFLYGESYLEEGLYLSLKE